MKKILVVEDSNLVTKVIRHLVEHQSDFEAFYADSYAKAKAILEEHNNDFFAALVDLSLPDAPNGEVVDYVLENKIPTIVLTGNFNEEIREKLLSKGIVDYITKEGRNSYGNATSIIHRLIKNQSIKVLIVDDSDVSRRYIGDILKRHLFQVYEAKNGTDAIRTIIDNPDIKLLITDYNMPQMDGFELVKTLRQKYDKTDLIIIGISSEGNNSLSAKFIKNGANDFINKPFCQEEFQCRILHNVEFLEMVEQIKDASNRDFLTGAYNRRYFFAHAQEIFLSAKNNQTPLALAVLDIDNFKNINDSFGHDAGDFVLTEFTNQLHTMLKNFLVARVGGEEFYVLLPGLSNNQAVELIDKIRQIISSSVLQFGGEDIYISFSAGVTNNREGCLEDQIKVADNYLYRAKQAGRNFIVGDSEDEEDS